MKGSLFFLHDDARLLSMIREGDEDALVQLFRSNRNTIMALVLRNHGTKEEAEDVLQESIIILWERVRAGTHRHEARLSTFIFGTARNLWLRRLARRKREIPLTPGHQEIASADDRSPLEALVETEESASVFEALQRLGEPCKTLLLLFYWEELSMAEIALRLGFANAETAKAKKYQCKNALRTLLNQLNHPHGSVTRDTSGF